MQHLTSVPLNSHKFHWNNNISTMYLNFPPISKRQNSKVSMPIFIQFLKHKNKKSFADFLPKSERWWKWFFCPKAFKGYLRRNHYNVLPCTVPLWNQVVFSLLYKFKGRNFFTSLQFLNSEISCRYMYSELWRVQWWNGLYLWSTGKPKQTKTLSD